MKIYIKDTDTDKIQILEAKSYELLSENFRQAPYIQASSSEITAKDNQILKDKLIVSREDFLKNNIDYYVTNYPQQIITKRALATQEIEDIRAANTSAALNRFNENFE